MAQVGQARVVTIETPELGDRSHLVHDGRDAVVIDPQRDIDRVLEAASAAAVRIVCVAETHLHNDYVSGGRELAAQTGAEHVLGGAEEVAFQARAAHEADEIPVGELHLRVLATPGHTPCHVAYALLERGRPVAVFTGGSLLYGTVGRTDLAGPDRTAGLTRDQHRSARRLVAELHDDVDVHPTHGFGSFCSSAPPSGAGNSTIGAERKDNLALQIDEEDTFAATLLSGLTAYPSYYAHMGALNRAGPAAIDLSPPARVGPAGLRRRIEAGEWVVDLRPRRAFAASHVRGTVGVELGTSFSTYLGWVLPWGTPVTLVGDTAGDVARAQRDLARIGIDRPAGMAVGGPQAVGDGSLGRYPVSDFPGLAATSEERAGAGEEPVPVLDVRRDDEWAAGHLAGATHIPLHQLEAGLGRVPGGEVWVHCASGFRASIAASLLDRAGRPVVLIDDDWDRAAGAGLTVVRP